jgi:hypothetical protein
MANLAIQYVPPDRLRPYPGNARSHSPGDARHGSRRLFSEERSEWEVEPLSSLVNQIQDL